MTSVREWFGPERQRVLDAMTTLHKKRWVTARRRKRLMIPLLAELDKLNRYVQQLDDAAAMRVAIDEYVNHLKDADSAPETSNSVEGTNPQSVVG